MSNQLQLRAIPNTASGLNITSSAVAWQFSPWKLLIKNVPNDIYVTGITFEMNFVLAADDTTYEHLFEIGVGPFHEPVTKIQIPHSVRRDTNVSMYMSIPYNCFLPEPYYIPAGSTVSIRLARATATAVSYNGIKMFYQSNQTHINPGELTMNNYLFAHGSGSFGETIR
jgi:hypothetical protein